MSLLQALEKMNGVAPMRDLIKVGVTRGNVDTAIREGAVVKIRRGWNGLPTISPNEFRAVQLRGFLTCSSAAQLLNLPAEKPHFHIRVRHSVPGILCTVHRGAVHHEGARVPLPLMVEDYLRCQPAEWSLALVDAMTRNDLLAHQAWQEIESRLPRRLARIVQSRTNLAESPLESVMRHRLISAKIPHSMQVQIGRFRVDFVIPVGIVVETHGAEYHASQVEWERDRRKVAWLRSQGWDVLEFTYAQVLEWEPVISAIRRSIALRNGGTKSRNRANRLTPRAK